MATVERFEDLEIWKLARELVNMIYEVTSDNKFAKDYGLKDQIRRSSVSIMNNIAEGFESRTVKRFINYLGQAKASCGETRSVCYVALDCNYIDQEKFKKLYTLSTKISGKIKRFIDYLENYDSNDRIKEAMVEYKSC
ncbi:four helix bundle protein [Aliifodinibius salipaludis]|uniref:Four helix bundle protein n=1 Tax=Fodinibius salipaludis TaxID=2032627 RepID=A0A2A2G8M5_9BACT|nr:four helix bundle protein [Aliifodinibius salipaludis]PAU93182.1 four helix bundle protein [Aliifodinibius salipaludis]